jgi:hypothetical protein
MRLLIYNDPLIRYVVGILGWRIGPSRGLYLMTKKINSIQMLQEIRQLSSQITEVQMVLVRGRVCK